MLGRAGLGARDVYCTRAFFAIDNLKADHIANFQIIKGNTLELFGVEEEVLRLAFARDKPKTTVRERLDCSCHIRCYYSCFRNPTLFLSPLDRSIVHESTDMSSVQPICTF